MEKAVRVDRVVRVECGGVVVVKLFEGNGEGGGG